MICRSCQLCSFLFVGAFGFGVALAAQNSVPSVSRVMFEVAPAPSWVKPIQVSGDIEPGVENSGTIILLIDRQESLERNAFYYHEVRKLTSENGVQNGASLAVSFNPAIEKLIFHSIQLIRAGVTSDRLDRSRIKLSENANNPDRLIHDSSSSADLVLNDVRVGDLIEFSYTREGANPLRKGIYSATYAMQWDFPVLRNDLHLTYASSRNIRFHPRNRAAQPSIKTVNGITELSYEANNVPGRLVQDDVPEGYSPRQRLEISEFQNWADFVRWAIPLFDFQEARSPELAGEIEKLRIIADPERRVVAALEFVQNEIRDLNFGSWVGDHPVSSPGEVMRRQSGDDKDKALLLVALLRGSGIDAAPALVSDSYRGSISEGLPSPELFDHVIVHLRLGSDAHWIDPWRDSQRGPLSQIYVARYGKGLILRSGNDSLTGFVAPSESWPLKKIVETYRLPTPENPGELDVVSDFHGLAADQVRASFQENTREETQKRYLEYYARTFPEIKSRRMLWYEELPSEDGCRVSEWYLIPHIWQLSEDKSQYVITVNPADILSALGSAVSPQRTDPLRLSYPGAVREELNIEMFEEWPLEAKADTTTTAFFRLRNEPSATGSHLQLNYAYESLRDRVEVSELAQYEQAVNAAKDSLGYTLRYSTPKQVDEARKPSTFNWAVAAAGLCFFGSASFFAFRYFRNGRLAIPRPPNETLASLNGIGGWLILLAIGQPLSLLGYIKAEYSLFPTMLKTGPWRSLTDPIESGYHAWWAPSLLFELFFNIFGVIFCGLLIALFFGKRTAWPRCFVVFLIVSVLGRVCDIFMANHIPAAHQSLFASVRDIGIPIVIAAIWIPYVFRSRRVKQTFRF
jgi:hypothetical protein